MRMPKCSNCGASLNENNPIIKVKKEYEYCASCLDDNVFECECCHSFYFVENIIEAIDKSEPDKIIDICPECAQKYYKLCKECEMYVDIELFENNSDICNFCK